MLDGPFRCGGAVGDRGAQGRRQRAMGRRGLRASGAEHGERRMGGWTRHLLGRHLRRCEDRRAAWRQGRMGGLHDSAVRLRRPKESAAGEAAQTARRDGALCARGKSQAVTIWLSLNTEKKKVLRWR